MHIYSKLVESIVDVSVDSLVELEDHLETALSVTRARKVHWIHNVFSLFTLFVENDCALIFNLLQAELMLKLVESLKEKVRFVIL